MTFTANVMISFPGQMEASLSPVSMTVNSPNTGTKIIDPTNILNMLDVGSKKYLQVLEKNCVGHSDRHSVNFSASPHKILT